MSFMDRIKHAYNAFTNRDPTFNYDDYGCSYRPDRHRLYYSNEKTTIASVYNRIALDVASLEFHHTKLDENDKYIGYINSGLEYCLNVEANIDQTPLSFIQDIVLSMFDEGVVAVVPVDTTINPELSTDFDIESLRTGKIITWYPEKVTVRLYNEKIGKHEDVTLSKKYVAIIENPFYNVMNETNSTLKRLTRKLSLLDTIDESNSSGKLDMIIQLPYVIKSEQRRMEAEKRRKDIEAQLTNSKYGIAYIDGTERITQLNRSLDNNLFTQVEYLTNLFYCQMNITKEILDGTANDEQMTNYYSRTIEPIATVIIQEMKRKFISKKARIQKQSMAFYRDPFKLIPISKVPDIADKLTRNEVLTANEVRQGIGYKPSEDPNADVLRNKNIAQPSDDEYPEKQQYDLNNQNNNNEY